MTRVSNNIAAFTQANLPSPIPVSDLSLATLLQYCNDKLTEYPLPIDSDGNKKTQIGLLCKRRHLNKKMQS